jgi:hypothetical protein
MQRNSSVNGYNIIIIIVIAVICSNKAHAHIAQTYRYLVTAVAVISVWQIPTFIEINTTFN